MITHPVLRPAALDDECRRLVVYVVWDRRGGVDDYIPLALAALRDHAQRVLVVVNGSLSEEGRSKLTPVSDEILVRENIGYDIWAHKAALDHLGASVDAYDEIVLTNDTWFGPVRPFGPLFARMSEWKVHFWGLTDHAREDPNPFTGKGVLPYHLQSFWIAVRREMFLSDTWAQYWRDLPPMPDYFDAVLKHESQFTEHFVERGYVAGVAYPQSDYDTENPSLFNAEELIVNGCPALKRRPFFHWPPFLDQRAVIGRWTLERAAAYGYPIDLIWQNLARNVPPKILNADAGMHEVIPDIQVSAVGDGTAALSVVVIAHIFYDEMTDEILDRAHNLPGPYDLVVTTPDGDRADRIRERIAARGSLRGSVDVRVLPSNDGRDQSAFLIGCRDVLLGGAYDLVVKLHSKKTPQDGYNVGRHFKEQQFDNLLNSRGYVANLLGLFEREAGLGLVYPPMIHIGYPTMGRAWWANKPGFERLAKKLGIRVPLDDVSPLAPYGSMFIARPEALRLLVEHPWTYDDFGGVEAYRDGGLAHILERMPSYAAGELGYHTRTVATFEYTSISHTALEFKLDEMSWTIPGNAYEKIDFVRHAGFVGEGRARDFLKMYMRSSHPRVVGRLQRLFDPAKEPGRLLRRIRSIPARIRGAR